MSVDLRHARLAMTTEPVHLDRDANVRPGLTPPVRHSLYEQMVLNRVFETEAERQYKAARIGGYCHLSSGQEAMTAGVVHALHDDDPLVPRLPLHTLPPSRG